MLTGLVLAGGKSSRMGYDKALLDYQGQSLLQHTSRLLADSGCQRVMISRNQLGFVQDLIKDAGPLGGIHAVLTHLQDDDELLIVPVDMPFLQAAPLRLLCHQGRQRQSPCYFQDSFLPLYLPVNPALRDYLAELLDNEGCGSVRQMLDQQGALSIPCSELNMLQNINTPAQWQHATAPRSA